MSSLAADDSEPAGATCAVFSCTDTTLSRRLTPRTFFCLPTLSTQGQMAYAVIHLAYIHTRTVLLKCPRCLS